MFFVLNTRTLMEVVIDMDTGKEISVEEVKDHHAPLDRTEMSEVKENIARDPIFLEAIKELAVPKELIVLNPWPFGSEDKNPASRKVFCLTYHRNPATNDPESNYFAYPLPLAFYYDICEKKITHTHWCYTGSEEDGMKSRTGPLVYPTKEYLPAEILPSLREDGERTDLKPLIVSQPEGVSFTVNGRLIEWQKWRFRVGFNYREGPVLHDVTYDGRPLFYRISLSEMHVPYADPRPPAHLKQVFDFGDIGLGRSANSLKNGCDCLGTMKYFSTVEVDPTGFAKKISSVICCHEQDNGILWKHTGATGVATVTRQRLLVLQTIITVGNYDYVFAWQFDQAGAINLEARATGILSTAAIDMGKKSPWGTVVAPGVLAPSHQHFINVRIDPMIDGHENSIVQEDVYGLPISELNPHGNAFHVKQTPITTAGFANASPSTNRSFKIYNPNKINPITMTPVSYKLVPHPSQLRLADPDAHMTGRAPFTQHHIWVSSYRDRELYCAGKFTNQSNGNAGGVEAFVARKDNVVNTDVVLWHTFALTHVPRIEDFPVMPVETHMISLKPYNFFTQNPALDVPLSTQAFNKSQYVDVEEDDGCCAGNGAL
ncbi:hypothetical protein PFICI_11143 [Pestalotiopsis fici W106-1]|uniref:Amine oxidase n=1 Tax=Pestalotiopsis fici (strain W106-1 / CGMCC3.15140) TaxID=1229662 RepID=W3WU07_PESFW|nr:uncharacterized protein PFICI_11143 [Pestalotiopsis fici W106-1]ETS77269.1 hypothetical protein PFICI_11143 [Pestalotiopsis fici W106-1]